VGSESVVRPADPSLVAETLVFHRGDAGEMKAAELLTKSSLSNARLWSDAELLQLSGMLFRIHDHFSANVYPGRSPSAFDIEVKLTSDGLIVPKQIRPYISTEFLP
jgi:hypothetical protein